MNQPPLIPAIFASGGVKNDVPLSDAAEGLATWLKGFDSINSLALEDGGIPPSRLDFNALFSTLSEILRYYQEGNHYTWLSAVTYKPTALVLGSDNTYYKAIAASGPGTSAGPKNPVLDEDEEFWENFENPKSSIPVGGIISYSGSFIGNHPFPTGADEADKGWAICNGQNGTPDLRNRFIYGGTGSNQKQTGGSTITQGHTLTLAQIPSHRHGISTGGLKAFNSWNVPIPEEADGIYSRAAGGSQPHSHNQNLPPYCILAYIMKLPIT